MHVSKRKQGAQCAGAPRDRSDWLAEEDEPEVQALLARCADYLELVAGLRPSPELAHDVFTLLPPGKRREEKVLPGLSGPSGESGELPGLLDAVRDYPEPGVWFLGLLLLDPAHRDQGLGTGRYRAFERWAQQFGAQEIRLWVAEQNPAASRFWQRLGFLQIERLPPELFGAKESVFLLWSRACGAGRTGATA